jgi:hypothetical protein
MATLKKLKEDTLNITSKILKKDEDFLPISPEFIKDLKNKTLLENSALKLSISDYELMCNNKTILNMMAIALNKPKAKLKKFCKHITVFKENISKSPKSIANKINGINGPITNLPKELRSIILDKFAEILPTKYVLLDWIDRDKIIWEGFSRNPNAIDLLENEYYNKIQWLYLSRNPNAIDLLKNNQDKIHWYFLSKNPNAIDLLKKNPDEIDWGNLSSNINAIDLLKKRIEYEKSLTNEELDELENKISWFFLSENPNAIDLLKKNQNKINWQGLSSNPNAIDLLKNNEDKINWSSLCLNPNAIDLLKDKIKYEKSLTDAELNRLKNKDKINWDWLSSNPNAIDLLLENKDKIYWYYLSKNPNAINLLKDRIKYEKSLTNAQLNRLENKIDNEPLSENPNAIDLLKENQDKINWFALSLNPSIFKAV